MVVSLTGLRPPPAKSPFYPPPSLNTRPQILQPNSVPLIFLLVFLQSKRIIDKNLLLNSSFHHCTAQIAAQFSEPFAWKYPALIGKIAFNMSSSWTRDEIRSGNTAGKGSSNRAISLGRGIAVIFKIFFLAF